MNSPLHRGILIATLVAAGGLAQSPPATADEPDWVEVVRTAVEHPRFAVRRAAAGRVARAGDRSVPALVSYQSEHGANAIPLEVVDAIGRVETLEPRVRTVLDSWARDRDFYWRAQALDGLAKHPTDAVRELCADAVKDPSFLYRVAGARGLVTSDRGEHLDRVRGLLGDPDPRARVRVALMLLERGDDLGLPELVGAFDRIEARFLDDPWGRRELLFVTRELRRIAGQDFGETFDEDPDRRRAARDSFVAWARARHPDMGAPPAPPAVPTCLGGIEVRSCRNGDLHLRFAADGRLILGLAPIEIAALQPGDLAGLMEGLPALAGRAVHGQVICDFLRVYVPPSDSGPEVHRKAAPGALPDDLLDWLKTFAQAIEKAGSVKLERELETRLSQFAGARKE